MATVLVCARIGGRLGRLARALVSGLWLGILSDRQLRALDERFYARDATYRTAAWNESGLTGWEAEAVRQAFAGARRIAVPGCGGGREVLALLEQGFDAVGYESHPALESYAEEFLAQRGNPGRARLAPRDCFPQDGGPWDGVLVGWVTYSLIWPRAARTAFLTAAGRALAPGGRIVLSCFERPSLGRELRLTATVANRLRRLRQAPAVELGDSLAPNRAHVFVGADLAGELDEAGFALESLRRVAAADSTTACACLIGRLL